jgi:hypothetical protein
VNSYIEIKTLRSPVIYQYRFNTICIQDNFCVCIFEWEDFTRKTKQVFPNGVTEILYSKFMSPYINIEVGGFAINKIACSTQGLSDMNDYYLAGILQLFIQLARPKEVVLIM